MPEIYMATVKPTPQTWDGLTPLTEGERSSWTQARQHPRRDSFTGYIDRVIAENGWEDWVPGEKDAEKILVQGWTRDECAEALRMEIAARGLTGSLEIHHANQ